MASTPRDAKDTGQAWREKVAGQKAVATSLLFLSFSFWGHPGISLQVLREEGAGAKAGR